MKKALFFCVLAIMFFCLGIIFNALGFKSYLPLPIQKIATKNHLAKNLTNHFVVAETNKVSLKTNNNRNCQFVEQYAQHGEDYVLVGIMRALIKKPIKEWRFLDIGNDPISCSNTYLLYKNGATGVLVEPIPYLQERILKTRPEDYLLKGAITDYKNGRGKFYINNLDGLSSLIKGQAKNYKKTYNQSESFNAQEIEVELFPINEVLKKHFQNGIDLLSIDVEGHALQILKAINFNVYRPKFIIVEFQEKLQINGKSNFINTLNSYDYQLIFVNDGDNGIFVDKRLL